MKIRSVFIVIYLFGCLPLHSQELAGIWSQYIELIADKTESEEELNEIIETLTYYTYNPINLNDTSNQTELRSLFFVSESQQRSLRAYIIQNGELKSIYELLAVSGFNEEIIHLLQPFVYIGSLQKEHLSLKNIFNKNRHFFVAGSKTILETPKGYTTKEDTEQTAHIYTGSPFRNYFKYQFTGGNTLFLGVLGEKDAGEKYAFNKKQYGVDFLGAYLQIKRVRFIENLIVGNYHLQFGQGLTLWSGAGFTLSTGGNIKKYAQGLKPATSFAEYGYLQGAAVTLRLWKPVAFSMFYSGIHRDASVIETNKDGDVLVFQSLLKTGTHRTEKEIQTQKNVKEQLYGTHLQYTISDLKIGYTFYITHWNAYWKPIDRPYHYYSFQGRENFSTGVDFSYVLNNNFIFGEASVSKSGGLAGIIGVESKASDLFLFSSYYRYYSKDYHSLYTQALGQNTSNSNEKGIFFSLETYLLKDIKLILLADIYTFPWMKYQVHGSSYGNDFSMILSKIFSSKIETSFQYKVKVRQQNISSDTLMVVFPIDRIKHTLHLGAKVKIWDEMIWTSKWGYTQSSNTMDGKNSGLLISQDLSFSLRKPSIQFAVRYAYFSAVEWDSRLYLYERDLDFDYSVPSYYGRGSRIYLFTYWKVRPQIKIGLRYSIWYYNDRETIGTGAEEIQGNTKQEVKAQIQIRL